MNEDVEKQNRKLNRIAHAAIAFIITAGFITCLFLEPDPSGNGTHEQLGLPSCLICRAFNIEKCPSCGMTTAITHIMHGNWSQANKTHPAAIPAFIFLFAYLLYSAIATINDLWVIKSELMIVSSICVFSFLLWIIALL